MMVKRILRVVTLFVLLGTSTKLMGLKDAESSTLTEEWVLLTEGSDIAYDKNYQYHPFEMKLNNGMLLREKDWNGFLKDFVESFPISKRHDILNGLTRFYKSYYKVEKEITFEPLRYFSGPYASSSYVSLQGSFKKDKALSLMKIKYYGSDWIFSERIKIVADDYEWESPELEFYRDHSYGKVWEYAFLDVSEPKINEVLNAIISSDESIIRFYGTQYYSDLEVTDRMKTDLRAMLNAIKAVNEK